MAKCSSCNKQFNHSTNVIPITSLNHMLYHDAQCPQQEGIEELMLSQACGSLKIYLLVTFFFSLGWPEQLFALQVLVWLNWGDIYIFLMKSGTNNYTTTSQLFI